MTSSKDVIKKWEKVIDNIFREMTLNSSETDRKWQRFCDAKERRYRLDRKYYDELETIVIPDNVKHIRENWFYRCYALKNVTIPNSVKSIGFGCFSYCESLESIVIPNSVTRLPAWCFIDCDSLKNVTLPDTITDIGDSCFKLCKNIDMEYMEENGFTELYDFDSNLSLSQKYVTKI